MTTDNFPDTFDPRRCILFLGAGFSIGAANLLGETPPVGAGLTTKIKELCELNDDDDDVNLMDMAEYAINSLKKEGELRTLLNDLYTVKKYSPEQEEILLQPWLRIYTTNYDNLISVHNATQNKRLDGSIFDVTDPYRRNIPSGAVVHLHGSISRLAEQKIDEALVLSRSSYVEQRMKRSQWWNHFNQDIRTAQYIFFLGYNIEDFEIASHLLQYPDLKERSHFFLRETTNPVKISKISRYGTRHSSGVAGFAELLTRARMEKIPKHTHELSSFNFVDPNKDKKIPKKPTGAEIQDLLAFGKFYFPSIQATIPDSEYVVFRNEALKNARTLLKNDRTLIVHGQLGSGKSIFIEELKAQLSNESVKCFVLRSGMEPQAQDLEYLKSLEAPLIFFEDYDSAISNMHLLQGLSENARFIVEISTSTMEVRMHEINRHLLGPVRKICVDRLGVRDINNLRKLLEEAGLSTLNNPSLLQPGLIFRDFLLASYKEPEIAQRLQAIVDPLLKNPDAKQILFTCCVLRLANISANSVLIEGITKTDPYVILNRVEEDEAVKALMEVTPDKIDLHSSILAEHILKKNINPADFTTLICNIASETSFIMSLYNDLTDERRRRARSVRATALRFSFIYNIVSDMENWVNHVENLYERCRRDVLIVQEPLFWLQYSIFEQERQQWNAAENYMEEAYERAREIKGYRTFQLDTNSLGLLCDIERLGERHAPVQRLVKIINRIEACRKTIGSINQRHHVLEAFNKIEGFVDKRLSDFTDSDVSALTHHLQLVVEDLMRQELAGETLEGTVESQRSLKRTIEKLGRRTSVVS